VRELVQWAHGAGSRRPSVVCRRQERRTGTGHANWRWHVVRIKRLCALVSWNLLKSKRRRDLWRLRISHDVVLVVGWVDKVLEIREQVQWRGLRLLGLGGGLVYIVVKGREVWVWRSVGLVIRALDDSHARNTGRQMTRSPLWQRSRRKWLPRGVVVVVHVELGEDCQGGVA